MITLVINGVDYSKKILSDFAEEIEDLEDSANSFISLANTRHRRVLASKDNITLAIGRLSDSDKTALKQATNGNFTAVYNGISGVFFCGSRRFELKRGLPDNRWTAYLVLKEV